jgi:hypothetical protein
MALGGLASRETSPDDRIHYHPGRCCAVPGQASLRYESGKYSASISGRLAQAETLETSVMPAEGFEPWSPRNTSRWIGVIVDGYSFDVRLSHSLLFAGFSRRTKRPLITVW